MSLRFFARVLLLLSSSFAALAADHSFVVASLKVMPVTGDKPANYALFEKLARRAAAAGADFVVTPEGYLDGYLGSPQIAAGITHEKLLAAADPIDGEWLTKVAA